MFRWLLLSLWSEGIKNFAWMNQAFLAKTGWRLLQREQGLWAQVFNAKYLRHCDILAAKDLQFQSSFNVWRGILYGAQVLSACIKCRVGSGNDILFWTYRWLSCGPLQQFALIDLSEDMLQLNVSNFLEDRVWDFNCLVECLPMNIVNLILSTHAGYNDEGNANWKWNFIWKLHVPPKVKTFLWVLCHKKLLKNAQRLKRKLTNAVVCPRCDCPLESCAHLFKDCTATLAIWNRLGIGGVESDQLMDDYCALEWFSGCNSMAILLERSVVHLYWMAPLLGICKINTYGSKINSSGLIGAGGLLRESCGSWIKGFSMNLGYGSIVEVELWGLFWGLNMAWDVGFRTMKIECDAILLWLC
ncbi:unnamed protein product [Prunus armeniaca]